MNNGGPAFPQHGWSSNPEVLERMKDQCGISVRDYFAARAPLPEPGYICEAMGWERDLRIGGDDDIGNGDQWQDSMIARWHELPTKTRMAVTCRHAFEWADAMLAARERTAETPTASA